MFFLVIPLPLRSLIIKPASFAAVAESGFMNLPNSTSSMNASVKYLIDLLIQHRNGKT
jgi:hypothetical protein